MTEPTLRAVGMLSPPVLLRLEGLVVAALSIFLFHRLGETWWFFALWLAPDLSITGYVGGPRLGAAIYNSFHNLLLPAILATYGILAQSSVLIALALVWFSHIGVDRLVGYGLKYATEFKETHLQRL